MKYITHFLLSMFVLFLIAHYVISSAIYIFYVLTVAIISFIFLKLFFPY